MAERIVEESMTPAGTPPVADLVEVQETPRIAAEDLAAEGRKHALAAGLRPELRPVPSTGATWRAIEAVAFGQDALLVASAARDAAESAPRFPARSPAPLVNHLSRPVLVVPSGKSAAERGAQTTMRWRSRRLA